MVSSIVTLSCLLACATPPSTTTPAGFTDQVEQALQRNALDGFAGTVSFTKEQWFPPRSGSANPANQEGHSVQLWEIITDGQGQIRAKITYAGASNLGHPEVMGETYDQMWMSSGHEAVVCEKQAVDRMAELSPTKLWTIRQRLTQVRAELEWLLAAGRLTRSGVPQEVLALDRDPQKPGAIVKTDGELATITFQTHDDTLLPLSIASDDGRATWRWTFSDYYRAADRWVPRSMEFTGHSATGRTKRNLYSQVAVVSASNRNELRRLFEPPTGQGDPLFDHIIAVEAYSESGKTIRVSGLPAVAPSTAE